MRKFPTFKVSLPLLFVDIYINFIFKTGTHLPCHLIDNVKFALGETNTFRYTKKEQTSRRM